MYSANVLQPGDNPMHDAVHRDRRVFAHLRSLCATDEARGSLDDFLTLWEARAQGRVVGTDRKGGKWKRASFQPSRSSKDKKGWLEGLIGGVGRKFS